jgi:Chaperone of endosialidase
MATAFAFPAAPTLNQVAVLPDGNSAQWNGYAWVAVDTSVVYPLAINLGGTNAGTAGAARVNLGLNAATGEFIVQQDGTVTNPGIAFASEPGLGWFRAGTGIIRMASGGLDAATFNLSASNQSNFSIYPRTAGNSQIELRNAASGSANFNSLYIATVGADATIRTGITGSATRGNLTIDAPNVFFPGGWQSLTAPAGQDAGISLIKPASGRTSVLYGYNTAKLRWALNLGDASAETGSNVGSNFLVSRFDDAGNWINDPFYIARVNGVATFGAAIVNGPSDRSLKENIEPIDNALDKVLALQGVSFNLIATPDHREIGLIAQDVQPIVPEVIQQYGEGKLALDYPKLTAILINAIKTLDQRLAAIGA